MSEENAEVQVNDTEMTSIELANQAYDELEAAEQGLEETTETVEPTEEIPEGEQSEAEEKPQETAIEAPQEWNQQLKDALASIPTPEGKQALIDAHKNMYRDYQADKQALAPMKQTAEMVMKHVQPLENELRMRGQSSQQYIDTVFATAESLNNDPHKTLEYLNQLYNFEPKAKNPENEEWVSPEQEQIKALQAELDAIKQGQQQFQNQQQQTQQQQNLEAQKAQAADTERQFKDAKLPDGTLAHPHFSDPEVRDKTIQLAFLEMQKLQQHAQAQMAQGIQPDPITPEQVAQIDEMAYQQAVRIYGKDVAEKPRAEKPQRLKATPPVDDIPNLTTRQITEREYDRLANS